MKMKMKMEMKMKIIYKYIEIIDKENELKPGFQEHDFIK